LALVPLVLALVASVASTSTASAASSSTPDAWPGPSAAAPATQNTPVDVVSGTLNGTVVANGGPVSGATVVLMGAGTQTPVTLGTTTSSSTGTFQLQYSATGTNTQLYVTATGGTAANGNNVGPARKLMAAIGTPPSAQITATINERTTVAAVFALAQFLDDTGAVTGPSPGLPNAMATAANLAETSSGKVSMVLAGAPNGTATEALPTFNTLASIVARCSDGTATDCKQLFAATKPPQGAQPTDTVAALLSIVQNPSIRPQQLFALRNQSAYKPQLTAAPGSWALTLVYTSGGFGAPGMISFDAAGNAWAGNNFQPPGTGPGLGVSVVGPTGQPILGSPIVGGGILGVGYGTAVDQHGQVWIGNFKGNTMSLLNTSGQVLSPPGGFTQGNISKPQGLAIDAQGDVWIANFGNNSVTEYPKGDPTQAREITGGGLEKSFGIAVDGQGNVWVTDGAESTKPGQVTRIAPDGTILDQQPITGGGLRSPQGVAIDSAGNAWVANLASASVTEIGSDGKVKPGSPLRAGGSLKGPWGIAVDGADHVWVAGFLNENVVELCGVQTNRCPPGLHTGDPISPKKTGYTSKSLQHLTAIEIDQSGNVWAANNWSSGSPLKQFVAGNGLVEMIGVATPVKTPMIGLPQAP
jgi:hypothetical protein